MTGSADPCDCHDPRGAIAPIRLVRDVGRDETKGRFADVEVLGCEVCGALWLCYFVEYEAFTASSRWARGLIEPALAQTVAPEDAPGYLAALSWVIFGGSYFQSSGQRGSGALRWDG